MTDDWLDVEELVAVSCSRVHPNTDVMHVGGVHYETVQRKIRLTPAALDQLARLLRDKVQPDPRLFDTSRF